MCEVTNLYCLLILQFLYISVAEQSGSVGRALYYQIIETGDARVASSRLIRSHCVVSLSMNLVLSNCSFT